MDDVPDIKDRSHEIELAELMSRRDDVQRRIDNVFDFISKNIHLKGHEAKSIGAMTEERAALESRIADLRKEVLSRSVAPSIADRLTFIDTVRRTMAVGSDDEIYQKRSALAGALHTIVSDVVFYPGGDVDVIILNGLAAYRIHKSGDVEEAWVRAGSKIGYAPPQAFYPYSAVDGLNQLVEESPGCRLAVLEKVKTVVAGRNVRALSG